MLGKHSTAELYLQLDLRILNLLGQSKGGWYGVSRAGQGCVKSSYEASAVVKPKLDDAPINSEVIVGKRWVWTIVDRTRPIGCV